MDDYLSRQRAGRQKLYDEVWDRPMVKVAKQYGISDVAVKKWCKKLKIPTPGPGYWAKVQHGKKVKQTPLPDISEDELRRFMFRFPLREAERTNSEDVAEELPEIASERLPENRIQVPINSKSHHPMVVQAIEAAAAVEPNKQGIVNVSGPGLVPIRVAPMNLTRAYRILTATLNAISDRGHGLSIGTDEHRKVYVTVNGELMSLEIEEAVDRTCRFRKSCGQNFRNQHQV